MRPLVSAFAALPLLLAAASRLPAAQPVPETVTTQRDQQALAVTIYTNDLALVRDQRQLRLPRGDSRLAFQEVAAQIRPETALLRDLTDAGGFRVTEQNFDFDLLTPQKLLEKYVGQQVVLVTSRPNPDGPGTRELREEALVLATSGGVVLQLPDRIETAYPGRIVFPRLPGTLRARPTLVVELHADADRPQRLELTYLTGGLSWQADYVASLAPDARTLDLSGWVTLTNQSGAAYPDATLQLVAGDVHRVVPAPRPMLAFRAKGEAGNRAPDMKEEGLLDYHLYTLARPTTLQENQTKQVALLSAAAVPVRKDYLLQGDGSYYRGRFPDLGDRQKVGVFLEFDNQPEAHLGMPLPRGVVRVYQQDSQGRPQFVGEDSVDHTPRNQKVRLRLGSAFDVTARRRQTDFRSLGPQGQYPNVVETAYRVELANAKTEPVTVTVQEALAGDWEMVQSSLPFTRESSERVTFRVPVPAGGAAALEYRVRSRW